MYMLLLGALTRLQLPNRPSYKHRQTGTLAHEMSPSPVPNRQQPFIHQHIAAYINTYTLAIHLARLSQRTSGYQPGAVAANRQIEAG
jgi:hypothetical protein